MQFASSKSHQPHFVVFFYSLTLKSRLKRNFQRHTLKLLHANIFPSFRAFSSSRLSTRQPTDQKVSNTIVFESRRRNGARLVLIPVPLPLATSNSVSWTSLMTRMTIRTSPVRLTSAMSTRTPLRRRGIHHRGYHRSCLLLYQ